MDEEVILILKQIGLNINSPSDLNGLLVPREQFLSDNKYHEVKTKIPDLKKKLSSSFMTSLQKNAAMTQKWPLLNLVRQILNVFKYKMVPVRKSDGYTISGVKKYKRFFMVSHSENYI